MNSISLYTWKYLVLIWLSFYKRGFNMNDNKKSCKSRAQQPKSSRHKHFFHHRLKISFDFFFVFHLSGSWDEMKRAQVRPAGRGAAVARLVPILWIRWCLGQIQMFSYLLTSVGPAAAARSVRPQIHADPLWSTQRRISDTRRIPEPPKPFKIQACSEHFNKGD